MNCEQVRDLLSPYLDDMLAPEELPGVSHHVRTCATCSTLLSDFRHFDDLLARLPRVMADQSLYESVFSSAEYRELVGAYAPTSSTNRPTVPLAKVRRVTTQRPQLVALPGGRSAPLVPLTFSSPTPARKQLRIGRLQVLRGLIVVTVALTLGIGSLISWHLWQKATQPARHTQSITPPAELVQGPLPAGTRFVFLRDASLWSAPSDGSTGIIRLTPSNTIVAEKWAIRPPLPGRSAGNMLAYIDLQQGFVHTIRSDGQSDTLIPQALLKKGVPPTAMWDTPIGDALLNSLSWSNDGNMLAFVGNPDGTEQTNLYLYTLASHEVHAASLPFKGKIADPVWSPDSARIAFTVTHNGQVSIVDYNVQNHGLLTLAKAINTPAHPSDQLLTLDWSPDKNAPAVTWSVGTIGHVRSIWWQTVSEAGQVTPSALVVSDCIQAIYSSTGSAGMGSWLLIKSQNGLPGDIQTVDLTGSVRTLTNGKQVNLAQWSPDGTYISYLESVSSSGLAIFHIINTITNVDTLVATGVSDAPTPAWSPDSLRLAYSTDTHIAIVNMQAIKSPQALKLRGPAAALSWSVSSPTQLALATSDDQQGLYLADTQQNTFLQLDKESMQGPILWTQIP